MPNRRGWSWPDAVGIAASVACLLHCLLLPLVMALAPALTRVPGVPEEVHLVALGIAVPATSWAMLRGYRLHGIVQPVALGAVGLSGLGLGSLAGFPLVIETCFTVSGSVLLTLAHLQNWRLRNG
jgi:hypothetical protein